MPAEREMASEMAKEDVAEELAHTRDAREYDNRRAENADVERLVRIFVRLHGDEREELLRVGSMQIVASVLREWRKPPPTDVEVSNEIRERIDEARPHFVLDSDARQCDLDLDEELFPDGRGELLMGPGTSDYDWAERLAEVYDRLRRDDGRFPFLDQVYDCDKDVAWARAVSHCAEFIASWRHRFFSKLFDDLDRCMSGKGAPLP